MPFNFNKALDALSVREKSRSLDTSYRPEPGSISYKGRVAIDFTARDGFGLSRHPKVIRAAQKQLELEGLGVVASRVSTGTSELHARCESRLSSLNNTKSSLLFNTRNQAVLSLVSCLAGERDCFITSSSLQSPFQDAAYLVDSECFYFNPLEPATLKDALEKASGKENKFVVLDSVSAFLGCKHDVTGIASICAASGANLILDDSLAFGFLGNRGGGSLDMYPGLASSVLCCLVDFSALLGLRGAVLAGASDLIKLISARSAVVAEEVPLSSPAAAALLESIEILELSISEKAKLFKVLDVYFLGLKAEGMFDSSLPVVPVLAVPFKSFKLASEFAFGLLERGVLADVMPSGARLSSDNYVRFIVTTSHKDSDINKALEAVSTVRARLLD